jgi:hypothetical protein
VVLDVALVVSHGDGAVRLDVLLDRRDLVLKLLLGLLGLRLGRLRLLLLVISERLRLVEASLLFLCVSLLLRRLKVLLLRLDLPNASFTFVS